MKTLKELIVDALKSSEDCIQITYLSKSCEPELSIDFEAMAENIYKAIMDSQLEQMMKDYGLLR